MSNNLRACPFLTAATVDSSPLVSNISTKPGTTCTPVSCMGPACHLWAAHASGVGDCKLALGAMAALEGLQGAQMLQAILSSVVIDLQAQGIIKTQILSTVPPPEAT